MGDMDRPLMSHNGPKTDIVTDIKVDDAHYVETLDDLAKNPKEHP